MITSRSKFYLAAFVALCVAPHAATSGEFRTGKYGSEFLNLGVGGRALGMGSAYSALASDVSAGYWNPAGLVMVQHPQVMLMHTEQFDGVVKYDYGSLALPYGSNRTVGIGLIRIGIDDIPETRLLNQALRLGETYIDEQGITRINEAYVARWFSDAEYALFLSYGIKRSDRFAFGLNAKILHKAVGDFSAWGLGFDLGALYNPVGNLQVGMNLQDVTTTILAWNTGTREILLPVLRAGLAYPWVIPGLGGSVAPAVDAEIRFESRDYAAQFGAGPVSLDTHLGWEYQLQQVFALRVGSDVGRLSAGAGISLANFQFDYAFLSHDVLGDTHRVSAMMSFGTGRDHR